MYVCKYQAKPKLAFIVNISTSTKLLELSQDRSMTVPQDYEYLHYSCLTYSQPIVISHAQTLHWTGSVNHPYMKSESCYHLNIDSILISTFNHRVSIHNINLLPAPPSYIALLPLNFHEVFLYLLLDSQALLEPLHQFLFIWWCLRSKTATELMFSLPQSLLPEGQFLLGPNLSCFFPTSLLPTIAIFFSITWKPK